MFGWINECVEALVMNKFGVDAWHAIKEKAKCTRALAPSYLLFREMQDEGIIVSIVL
jgi:hypothetical protein